jgi:hypothetical protein
MFEMSVILLKEMMQVVFFLIAFPGLSSDLINYLETLPRQGYWVDWWSRSGIDDRLRRRPHMAARFADLVRLEKRS